MSDYIPYLERCWLFHDWGKFTEELYTQTLTPSPLQSYTGGIEAHTKTIQVTKQKRACKRCGKVQVKSL